MNDLSQYLEPGGNRSELIVLVHGLFNSSRRLAEAREVLRTARPNADIFAPSLPYGDEWFCTTKAESIVLAVLDQIDAFVSARGGDTGYQSISIVGHSFGAVLARKIVIVANGEQKDKDEDVPAPFEHEFARYRDGRRWAGRIGRMVLLAGMNRGWSSASAMNWIDSVALTLGGFLGGLVTGGRLTALAIRRGAPFLVQTRLQWLSLMDPDYGRRPDIVVVQLLGTSDDLVAPDDNVDYSIDLYANSPAGKCYFYLEVEGSNHGNVVEMAVPRPGQSPSAHAERRSKFLSAMNDERAQLETICITREQMADNLPPEPDPRVNDLVFVIHGIRDKGFWTQKLARNIKRHAPAGRKIASWTESYGYFAMLPFLSGSVRQRKVEWLMDRYVEARARYPKATFHFVGHSNGTYLAAQALKDYPAVRFDRIVFAGSVVRTEYEWLELTKPPRDIPMRRPQVGSVLNYVATRDWVVALLTNGLRGLPSFNLGGAGHNGFKQSSASGPVHQVNYIPGSHGAGLEEDNWDDIARFIVSGTPPTIAYPRFSATQDPALRLAGKAAIVLFPALVICLLGVGVMQFWSMFDAVRWAQFAPFKWLTWLGTKPTEFGAALRAIGFFLYMGVLYVIVTRV